MESLVIAAISLLLILAFSGNRFKIVKSLLWAYYIRLDIKMRDLELHKLTLNHEKTVQKLQSFI